MTSTNLHTLSEFAAAEIPGHPNALLLSLRGEDGAHERFTVSRAVLEQIVTALDAELVRLRAQEARRARRTQH